MEEIIEEFFERLAIVSLEENQSRGDYVSTLRDIIEQCNVGIEAAGFDQDENDE